MKPTSVIILSLVIQVRWAFSYFEGLPGDSDVFRNPNCGSGLSSKHSSSSSSSCDCARFSAECVRSGCRECKCRRKTRIYRSDVRKCLSDVEARDPWCRYQFLKTKPYVIPTIDLSRSCTSSKCSQPINAPFDKTKHVCHVSWVNYLENGTWHENPVRKFQEIFDLRSSDYSSERGYMYSLEWKTSEHSPIPKRLFQVSLECVDRDSMKESYCIMFRVRGENEPILSETVSEPRSKTNTPDSEKPTFKPTKYIRRRVKTPASKIVVVNDNFAVILAAIAGALGTALVIIPLALFFRRTTRQNSRRNASPNGGHQANSIEEIDVEPGTSEETLSSYTSLKRNREEDDPPSIYQPLRKTCESELPDEEPIYISVSGDEEEGEPVKIPPIYHVLEDLETEMKNREESEKEESDRKESNMEEPDREESD